ncbi:aminoacylase-1-like [Apostichopus japonicus]|uniref:aminoacylase-1-like n=1 Tax=Stichopus japonicus TaxID=307972 RepID=UPI003AB26183
MASKKAKTEEKVVTTFREYLRCKTVHPEPVYDGAVKLLLSIGEEAGLECQSFKLKTGDPVVIMKWEGTDPSLKCLLLNSHMDVVPVYMEHWKWDPFGAEKSEEGNIYARGTQVDIAIYMSNKYWLIAQSYHGKRNSEIWVRF